MEQPEESEADRINNEKAKLRAELESAAATPADVVRKEDRKGKGIAFAKGLPVKRDGTYLDGYAGKKHETLDWKRDRHRGMICNMREPIEKAALKRYGKSGTALKGEKEMFWRLVKEMGGKAKRAGAHQKSKASEEGKAKRSGTSWHYIARVALGLIVLLASILG
jgi:hypothetical protein